MRFLVFLRLKYYINAVEKGQVDIDPTVIIK